jgi:protein disulfide-isomerase A1
MRLLFIFFLILLTNGGSVEDILEGENPYVAVLAEDNFETFVSGKNSASAVMFTSPWCVVCAPILALWAETARLVQTSSDQDPVHSSLGGKLSFGVVDATKYEQVAVKHSIQGFPTLKIFIDQEVFSYVHESIFTPVSASLFLNWINKHTKRRNVVTSEEQLAGYLKQNHLVAVGFFDSSDDSKKARDSFTHSSMHFEDVFFIEIESMDLAKKFATIVKQNPVGHFPAVAMVYDHDAGYAELTGPLTSDAIDGFIRGRRLLTVNVFQPGTIEYILDAGLPMLFLVSPAGYNDGPEKEALKSAAETFLGEVVAVTVGSSQPWEQKLGEVLDVREIRTPVLRILKAPPSNHHDHNPSSLSQSIIRHGLKFKPVDDVQALQVPGIVTFINATLNGELKPYIRSELEPEDPRDSYTPGSILINAVGTNFHKLVVQDFKRDILVVYHAPWCGFCRKFMPTLREVGTRLAHAGSGLKLVKIDATRNEISDVDIEGYPTIKLYKAIPAPVPIRQRESISYEGDRTADDLIAFLHANAANKFTDTPGSGDGSVGADNVRYAFEEL